jgi:hypothetical protein
MRVCHVAFHLADGCVVDQRALVHTGLKAVAHLDAGGLGGRAFPQRLS